MNVTFCQSLGAKDLSGATLLTMASAPADRRGTRGEIWSRNCNERKNRFGVPTTTSVEKGKARGESKREDFIFCVLFDFYCGNILLSVFFQLLAVEERVCMYEL